MISRQIGRLFSWWRDGLARGLLRIGLAPNHLTVMGTLLTVGAGVAVAAGRTHWRLWAVSLLVAAGACDLLDGAMARIGNRYSRFGGILDSVCDRLSDAALYMGPLLYLVMFPGDLGREGRPNVTLVVLAAMGLVWAYLTSYIRARAKNDGIEAGGGFWQRPERVVTILLGLAFHHLTTAIWILGILPATTVARRLWYVRRCCAAGAEGGDGAGRVEPRGPLGILLWRWPRGGWPFDLYAGTIIAMLVFWRVPPADPLMDFLVWLVRA